MEDVIRKKLNLLVHLAKIDGKFDETEKEVLAILLQEAGIDPLQALAVTRPVDLNDYQPTAKRSDLLYWALRIIKADGHIHADESAYCKALAVKLNYKPEVIDYFTQHELGPQDAFKAAVRPFAASSV